MSIKATNKEMRYAFLRDADITLDKASEVLANARSMAAKAGDQNIKTRINDLIVSIMNVQDDIRNS